MNVRLCFDADEAGLKATERAIEIAQTVGVDLKVVTLPDGAKDPDEIIMKDAKIWREVTEAADDAVSWVLKRYEGIYDKSTAEGKRQLSSKALAIIKRLQDPVEREHYLKNLAVDLGVSEESLKDKLEQTKTTAVKRKGVNVKKVSSNQSAYEDDFLALNLVYLEVRDSLKIVQKAKLHSESRESVKIALGRLSPTEKISVKQMGELKLDENYVKILELLVEEKYSDWTPADIMAEAMALARRISKEFLTEQKNNLTEAIAGAEARGDQNEVSRLLEEYQQLLKEL